MKLTENQVRLMQMFASELMEMDAQGAIELSTWPRAEKFIRIIVRGEHA